ncbi:MAG TPA: AI-2E family transporter [Chroococcales cyanobacterium]
MNQNINVTISPKTILFTLSILLGLLFLSRIPGIIAVLLIASILAAAMAPAVGYFQQRLRLGRTISILLIYLLMLGGFALAGLIIVPVLVDQVVQLIGNLPVYGKLTQEYLLRARSLGIRIPGLAELAQLASKQASVWLQSTFSYTIKVLSVFLSLFGILVTTFFLLNDGAKLKEGLIRLSPPRYRMRLANLFEPVANQLGAYVRGQLTVISFLVTYLAIALSIARVPFSLVLALIAGLLDIIPMVGILGVIPAALVALTVSWKLSLLVVVLFTVGNFLEGNVISPLILSKSVDVPPILIFFSLMIGAQFMGIVGALLAVPVTAAALVIVKNLYLPSIEEERE